MTQEEIKCRHIDACMQIKASNEVINQLQKDCQHPNTFEGTYSYRVGATMHAVICFDCGAVVKDLLTECPSCEGEGGIGAGTCSVCNGNGHVKVK